MIVKNLNNTYSVRDPKTDKHFGTYRTRKAAKEAQAKMPFFKRQQPDTRG